MRIQTSLASMFARLFLCLALAETAHASPITYKIIFEGTVNRGFDPLGIFGLAGSDLRGLNYSATLFLTLPQVDVVVYDEPNIRTIQDGSYSSPYPSSELKGTLNINGFEKDFGEYPYSTSAITVVNRFGSNVSPAIDHDTLSYSIFDIKSQVRYNALGLGFGSYTRNLFDSLDIVQNIDYQFQSGERDELSSFQVTELGQSGFFEQTSGSLQPSHVTFQKMDQVPEPTTWIMMLIGVSILANVLSRKRLDYRPRTAVGSA